MRYRVPAGYMGKIAYIDLTKPKVKILDLKEEYCRLFIGGSGLAAKYIYDMVSSSIDAFDPDNALIIMTGPMTGTSFPTSGLPFVLNHH